MIANKEHCFTPDEYLKWEPQQEIKYEYVDGEVLAMTGGTIPHNDIALNIATALKAYLRGKKCRTSIADAKLAITENGPFHYPDVMVSCDERDRHATKFLQHPCLIVEVLSESTAAYDRGDKFKKYRRIKTLLPLTSDQAIILALACYESQYQYRWLIAFLNSIGHQERALIGKPVSLASFLLGLISIGFQ